MSEPTKLEVEALNKILCVISDVRIRETLTPSHVSDIRNYIHAAHEPERKAAEEMALFLEKVAGAVNCADYYNVKARELSQAYRATQESK